MPQGLKPYLKVFIVLLLLGLLSFGSSLKNDFLWDDDNFITKNKTFQKVENPFMFFSDNTKFCEIDNYQRSIYRPIRSTIYWVSYKLFGLNPMPLHLISFLLHVFNAFLLFIFSNRLLKSKKASFAVSLFFLLHPSISEAVFSINYMADPLFTFFVLLCFVLLAREKVAVKEIFLIFLFYLFALFSKETAVSFLFLAGFYVFLYGKAEGYMKNKILFLSGLTLITAFYLALRYQMTGSMAQIDVGFNGLVKNILLIPILLFQYIRMVFFGIPYSPWYEPDLSKYGTSMELFSWVVLIVLFIALGFSYKKNSRLVFLSSWFLFSLLPVLHILPVSTTMAGRFLYFPLIGMLILLAELVTHFKLHMLGNSNLRIQKFKYAVFLVFAFFAMLFSTLNVSKLWGSEILLFREALNYYPNSAVMNINMGAAYYDRKLYKEALPYILRGIRLGNRNPANYSTLTFLLEKERRYKECVVLSEECLSYYPNARWCKKNLAVCKKEDKEE